MEQVDKIITSKEEKTTIKESFFIHENCFSPSPPSLEHLSMFKKKRKKFALFTLSCCYLEKMAFYLAKLVQICMCTREQKWTKCPNFKVIQVNLEDSGSSLATIKNPTVNDEKCGRASGYCRCFDFLVNIVSSVIRASAANQSFYNIEVAIVLFEVSATYIR